MKSKVTLALETGIDGGSICLLRNGEEIASWVGDSIQSKSVVFLESLKNVLITARVKTVEITEMVISTGPGSHTGLRIGYSIAKGLKIGSGVKIMGASPLSVILDKERPITIGVFPIGRDNFCWKMDARTTADKPQSRRGGFNFCSGKDFFQILEYSKPSKLILHPVLRNEPFINRFLSENTLKTQYCDVNLARIVGKTNCCLVDESQIKIHY